MSKLKSYLFVTIQFGCLGLLAWLNGVNYSWVMLVLIFLSVFVGLLGIWEMRQSTLSVLPDVSDTAKLVTSGIYNHIRHPMYTAVLLFALGLVINIWSWLALGVYLVLLVDLILKARFEEKQLEQKFEEYEAYKERTKRFLPFVF